MTMIESLELPSEEQDQVVEDQESFPGCRSHLVVDLGSSYTVATLYDIVEGQYRLVSRGISLTTMQAPWYDVQRGWLILHHLVGDSRHTHHIRRDFTLRVHQRDELVGDTPPMNPDRTEFSDTIFGWLAAGGLHVKHDVIAFQQS